MESIGYCTKCKTYTMESKLTSWVRAADDYGWSCDCGNEVVDWIEDIDQVIDELNMLETDRQKNIKLNKGKLSIDELREQFENIEEYRLSEETTAYMIELEWNSYLQCAKKNNVLIGW